jgi:hypothetical protein
LNFLANIGNFLISALTHSSGGSQNADSEHKNREVTVQAMQYEGGHWINAGSYMNIANDGYALHNAMENAQRQFPNHRIRAVNGHGHLLAML